MIENGHSSALTDGWNGLARGDNRVEDIAVILLQVMRDTVRKIFENRKRNNCSRPIEFEFLIYFDIFLSEQKRKRESHFLLNM